LDWSTKVSIKSHFYKHTYIVKTIFFICAVIFGMLIIDSIRVYSRIQKSSVLVANSESFEQQTDSPELRILVLGDSTAVGTGAFTNKDSTAGRLGNLYPEAEIVNKAVNGLKIQGLIDILATMPSGEHFDIVLIQVGANDVIRMTSMSDIRKGIDRVLNAATIIGDRVIVLHAGDIGQVPFFPWYAGPLYRHRSLEVRDIYIKAAEGVQVAYVDLVNSTVGDTLRRDPERYYASDGLHLSGDGYGLWFAEIKKHLPKE
jgi:lysophospholipase L1-like esterase